MPETGFASVTELPGLRATAEQFAMMVTRYDLARRHCRGKDVLEVACGSGIGLGYLARDANHVIGGDVDEQVLAYARRHYQGRSNIEILQLDAHQLPLSDNSLDTVVLFEAVYYLADPLRFLREALRTLRPGGMLLLCSVNCEWHGFNPSPFSVRYFSARRLAELLRDAGFEPCLYGAFPDVTDSLQRRLIARVRRWAVRRGLIPRTMRGKELLKRMFYGPLAPLTPELHAEMAEPAALIELPDAVAPTEFKVVYAVATSLKPPGPCSAAA